MAATDKISEMLRAATIACHPLLRQLQDIGHCRAFNGGRSIIAELETPMQVQVAAPKSISWYSGYEVIKFDEPRPISNLHDLPTKSGTFTASEWPIRQIGMLAGPDIAERTKDLANMLANTISMGGPPEAVNSLPSLVNTSPTVGTVGGIDRNYWKFWRNLSVKYTQDRPIDRDLLRLVMSRLAILRRGKTVLPDLILMGEDDFNDLHDSIPEDERHSTKYSEWGFKSLLVDHACVVLDQNIGPCIDNYSVARPRIYFLHTEFFWWRWHANRDWTKIDQSPFIADQDEKLPSLYAWAGNLTMSCAYAQGVLHRF